MEKLHCNGHMSWWITHLLGGSPTSWSGLGGLYLLLTDPEPETSKQGNVFPKLLRLVWSGHASGPARRKALKPKPHERQFHHFQGYTATQTRCGQLGESQATDEGSIPVCISKHQERCETSLVLVRAGQDQTYPSFMKECKQLSSRWSDGELSNVVQILNIRQQQNGKRSHPQVSISQATSS